MHRINRGFRAEFKSAGTALEMQQNASRDSRTFEHAQERRAEIMAGIHALCYDTAEEFGAPGNNVVGANIASFLRVARAMVALRLVSLPWIRR